eukprot:COSAG02_NODE_29338_length_571_cov_0.771186_1_plen_20_part_10
MRLERKGQHIADIRGNVTQY